MTVVAVLLGINLLFAALYAFEPGSVANAGRRSFSDDFFFSVETLATVGYGEFYPATLYAHVVATCEILSGVVTTAILTGLIFVRFSRAKASFVYASQPVIARYRGQPTLMFRVAHRRSRALFDAVARLDAVLPPEEVHGQVIRPVEALALRRGRLPVFAMSWTLMHALDETSPLHALLGNAPPTQFRLFLTLEARDSAINATVHDVHAYAPQDVVRGKRFADMVRQGADGRYVVDLARLSLLEPDPEPV